MNRKYGKPQEGERTAKQWAEMGYKPNDTAKGVERWFGLSAVRCYKEDEVAFVGMETIKEEQRAKRRAADRERRARRKAEDSERERLIEVAISFHTAHQWLTEHGRIPKESAEWRHGDPRAGQSEKYYYCHLSDTREPSSEGELATVIEREEQAYRQGNCYCGKMMTQWPQEG